MFQLLVFSLDYSKKECIIKYFSNNWEYFEMEVIGVSIVQ